MIILVFYVFFLNLFYFVILVKKCIYLYIFVMLRLLVFHFSTSLQNKEMISKNNNLREPSQSSWLSEKNQNPLFSRCTSSCSAQATKEPMHPPSRPHGSWFCRLCQNVWQPCVRGTKDAREWQWNKLFTGSVSSAESSIFLFSP